MNRLMVVGTLVTGFYAIRPGSPERLSPVFRKRGEALGWVYRQENPEEYAAHRRYIQEQTEVTA